MQPLARLKGAVAEGEEVAERLEDAILAADKGHPSSVKTGPW